MKRTALALTFIFALLISAIAGVTVASSQNGTNNQSNTAPTVSIVYPTNQTFFNVSIEGVYFNVLYETKDTLSWVGFSIDGGGNVTATGNSTDEQEWINNEYQFDGGHNTLTLYANDTDGNWATPQTITYLVNFYPGTTPPPTYPTPAPVPPPSPSPPSGLTRVSTVTSTLVTNVTATIPVGIYPFGVAVTPNGEYAYVTNEGAFPTNIGSVSVISTATNTVTATLLASVGRYPFGGVAVTPDGLYVYVPNEGEGYPGLVWVISTATNTVTATVPVGSEPTGVAVTPNGEYAYVTNYLGDSVSVISTATNTVTATIPVGSYPRGVAVTPNGACVYVTNSNNSSVSVISTATNTVTATIPVGSEPGGVAVTPNGEYAYVTNTGSNESPGSTVSLISTATNTVTATIPVGSEPGGVAVTPNGAYAYVTNGESDSVSVISTGAPTSTPTSTPTISPTSTVPEFPTWIILPLFAVIILLSTVFARKRIPKKIAT
jgi:YVTN family beta-propeller protein